MSYHQLRISFDLQLTLSLPTLFRYVGVGAMRIRQMFTVAKERAPAIIFIDELDSIGSKRSGGDDDNKVSLGWARSPYPGSRADPSRSRERLLLVEEVPRRPSDRPSTSCSRSWTVFPLTKTLWSLREFLPWVVVERPH